MAPKTLAERQKAYRERLKSQNPEKLKAIKKKNAERAVAYYRNKIKDLTEEQKKELKEKRNAKKNLNRREVEDTDGQNKVNLAEETFEQPLRAQLPIAENRGDIRKLQRRIEYKIKKETQQLRNDVQKVWRGYKSLQKRCLRQQKIIHEMQITCNALQNKMDEIQATCDSRHEKNDGLQKYCANVTTELDPMVAQDIEDNTLNEYTPINNNDIITPKEYTPLKRTENYLNENFKDVETPQKQVIKKTVLEFNVLKDSLKEKFVSSSNQTKSTLKEIIDSKIVRKYKLKTSLTQSLGLKNNFKTFKSTKQKRNHMINKIRDFYLRDDVSRATAGKKEYKTLHKIKMQKRYLLQKLKSLHKKYVNEVGSISFSTFKKYRPFYVVRPNIKNLESCACVKHSNMEFMANKLKSHNLVETDNLDEIISTLVCDKYFKTCMYSNCDACMNNKIQGNENLTERLKWYAWTLLNHEYGEPENIKKTKKMTKTEKEGSAQDLIDTFNKELPNYKRHVYNIHHQYRQYKYCTENLKDNDILIHIDFSENWTCKYFQEIQAMHFGAAKTQITLHTGVYYMKGTGPVSFCSISPNNTHNPEAIWAHMDPVLLEIKLNHPNINNIHFFSDGPSTQYRQKKNFYLFCKKIFEYGFSFGTWSFFEASHGKGAADGIGGAIKRTLDSVVAQGNDIPNAYKAFDVLKSSETSIKVFYIPAEKIQNLEPDFGTKIIPLKNTMKLHQLVTEEKFIIKHRELSCFCQNLNGQCDCHAPSIHSFKENEGNTDKTNKLYILDEITGDIRAICNETNDTEHAEYNENDSINSTPIEILVCENNNDLYHEKKKKKVRYVETDEEDSYSVHDSTDGSGYLEDALVEDSIEDISEIEDTDKESECDQLTVDVDSFILVKFKLEKRIKYYIGQVLEITGKNTYKVKFLRNKGNSKFAFPINNDVSLVYKDDIESVFSEPTFERRGIKTFDVSKFNFKIE